jgi:hypothetical protein
MTRGAPGTTEGVAVAGAEFSENPQRFCLRTVKVYVVPLVRPVTVQLRAVPPTEQVALPGVAETVNPITVPVVLEDATQETTLLPGA